jgi:DNA invertase Pin-like site-specific DNA recombinase
MLRIGYVRLRDAESAGDTQALKALGCHVVRAEDPDAVGGGEDAVLNSILEFIGPGDQLVVMRLAHLAQTGRAMLQVVDRLETRGASLYVMEPELCSQGADGRALRAALEAVAVLEPPGPRRARRPAAAAQQISALRRAGVGPVEIARRLGVSRMTVWRKLKAVEA